MNTGQTQDELSARKASQGRQTAAGGRQVLEENLVVEKM